jgi:hypothetical protein
MSGDPNLSAKERVALCSTTEGGLSAPWYGRIDEVVGMELERMVWEPGEPRVILEGAFTVEELRAIADHMDEHRR